MPVAGPRAASLPAGRRAPRAARPLALVRENPAFVAVLAVGLGVRALAVIAYTPALFFGDSWGYVVSAFSGHPVAISNIRPSGYAALMRVLTIPGRDLTQLVVLQHLAGLATGTIVYVVLVRARIPRTAAALASALVFLDGYVIALEQHLMPEAFFTPTLLVSALLLCWPALRAAGSPPATSARVVRPGVRAAAIAGLLLAAAILQRTAGLFAIPFFAVYLLWIRVGAKAFVAFVLALALPVLAYAAAEKSRFGTFGLSQTDGWVLYGRVAGFADCAGARIPADALPLCETAAQRASHPDAGDWYIFDLDSPAVRLFGGYATTVSAQRHSNQVLGAFAHRIIVHQPLDYLEAVARDVVRYFTPGATPFADNVSATSLPADVSDEEVVADVRDRYLPSLHLAVRSPSGVVRAYRSAVHVPRPVLALLVLAAIVALVLRTPWRREILLLSGSGLGLIVGAAASAGFGLRYLEPSVPLIAIGGTLAAFDLWARFARRGTIGHDQDAQQHSTIVAPRSVARAEQARADRP